MTFELILFFILAAVSVAAAVAMLITDNAVYSALFLILNFSVIAVFYVMLSAPFIAMAQITVYAGAIMVLFLFVIMLLGGELIRRPSTFRWQPPLAIFLGVTTLLLFVFLLLSGTDFAPPPPPPVEASIGGPENIGLVLFNDYLVPFEVTSVLLLVAMIGAILLTRVEKIGRPSIAGGSPTASSHPERTSV